MAYPSLWKLRYTDRAHYDEIYQARFRHPDTLHLDLTIHDHPAFLCQTAEVFQLIFRIQKANERVLLLRHAAGLPAMALAQFTRKCLVDEVVLTNDIEGVNSTRREIHDVLDRCQDTRSRLRFQGLVRQYAALQQRAELPLATCQDLRALYDDLVLREVLAEDPKDAPDGKIFRKGPVSVTNAAQKEIHQGVYPESALIQGMEQALAFLHDETVNPFLRISGFHYLFGYLHPFYNGNGRLSRFLSSYLLSRELDPLVGYRLSYTIKAHIRDYYEAFKLCNDPRNRGDLTPFVLTFLSLLAEAMDQLEAALRRRADDLAHCRAQLEQDPLLSQEKYRPLVLLLLQAGLFAEEGISTRDLLTHADISYTTLKTRLAQLDRRGLLQSHMVGREKFYRLDLQRFASDEDVAAISRRLLEKNRTAYEELKK